MDGWIDGPCKHTTSEHQQIPNRCFSWAFVLMLTLGATFGFPVVVSISSASCKQTTGSVDMCDMAPASKVTLLLTRSLIHEL